MSQFIRILQKFNLLSWREEFRHVRKAVTLIKEIIEKEENRKATHVSFNGGKDATIVLYLTAFAYHELSVPTSQISVMYFEEPNPFEEVDSFRHQTQSILQFQEIKAARNFKESLTELKQTYPISFIVMGSRKTDPYCGNLEHLSPSDTSKGYPEFIRVNPIITWDYQTVWDFILTFQIPYCPLYSQGYTYLGNKNNTSKNSHLLLNDGTYAPAWTAKDQNECSSRTAK